MKVLIIGVNGQLGSELITILEEGKSEIGILPYGLLGAEVAGYDLDTLDITSEYACRSVIAAEKPDVVINCAAYTNVDGCETDTDAAFTANSIGPRNLAICCKEGDVKLIHVSTDYVFSGDANSPQSEFDLPAPQSAYGKTKLLGEKYISDFCDKYFIVRTAWLYGYNGKNFVKTIVNAARKNGELKVVNDQMGNPTNANDLAHHLLALAVTDEYGIYHCTGKGVCSWYDFAAKIVEYAKINAKVLPCTTAEFASPTKRPAYSALDNRMLRVTIGDNMRSWEEALLYYFENFEK